MIPTSKEAAEFRKRRTSLPGLVSLAELGLGKPESDRLLEWARTTARPIEARSIPADFGLVFIATATVIARDESSEGTLWPHLVSHFGHGADKVFAGPHLLHADVRDAIRVAVKREGLRHALDRDENEQRWYLTILLQCGWTKRGLAERLGYWLAGQAVPRSMALLLNDPELESGSFRQAVDNLKAIRRGERTLLPPSSWLDGDLRDVAVAKVAQAAHLGTARASHATSSDVRLSVPPHGLPAFRIAPGIPADAFRGNPGGRLRLTAGQMQTFAFRQPDDSYSTEGPIEIPLSRLTLAETRAGEIEVRIYSDSGIEMRRELLELYAADDGLDVFVEDRDGTFLREGDPWTYAPPIRRELLVRSAEDLPVEGAFARPAVAVAGSRWQIMAPSEFHQIKVRIGSVVWDLPSDGRPRRVWASPIQAAIETRDAWVRGKNISWLCDVGCGDARIERATIGGRPLRIERLGLTTSGGYRLTLERPDTLPKTFRFRFEIVQEGQAYFAQHEAVRPYCNRLLVRRPEGLAPLSHLTWAALREPVSFCGETVGVATGDRPYLFEGEQAVAPLLAREAELPELAGLGGRITIRTNRFNGKCCGKEDDWRAENPGCLRSVEVLEAREGLVRLVLDPEIEWTSADSGVELLSQAGDVVTLEPSLLETRKGSIDVLTDVQPVAAVVLFQGASLGRWVGPAMAEALKTACRKPGVLAVRLLWLLHHRFPIERNDLRMTLAELTRVWTIDALAVALNPRFPKDEASMGAWRGLLRDGYQALLDNLRDTRDGTNGMAHLLQVAEHVMPHKSDHPVCDVFKTLAEVDPYAAFLFLAVALAQGRHAPAGSDGRPCIAALKTWASGSRPQDVTRLALVHGIDAAVLQHLVDSARRAKPWEPTKERNEVLRGFYYPELRTAMSTVLMHDALASWEYQREEGPNAR